MNVRRRPLAALFSALFVWLTAATVVRVSHPGEMRLVGVEIDGTAQLAITAARLTVGVPRAQSQSSTIPRADVPLPAVPTTFYVAVGRRIAPMQLASVRRATGLERTHDATGPPERS